MTNPEDSIKKALTEFLDLPETTYQEIAETAVSWLTDDGWEINPV